MAIATEKLIPGVLPPKKELANVDFLGILDAFDPSTLPKNTLEAFASRDPYVTAYSSSPTEYYQIDNITYPVPILPAEKRLEAGLITVDVNRKELLKQINRFEKGLPNSYGRARNALIKAIGSKVCLYLVETEFDALSPGERTQQEEDYQRWARFVNRLRPEWKAEDPVMIRAPKGSASLNEKVTAVRKHVKNRNLRSFSQKDFASLIDYPLTRYADAERDEACVDDVLLEKLILICHANPYYLYDRSCEAAPLKGSEDPAKREDSPTLFTSLATIFKWIQKGKPRYVKWTDAWKEN